MSEPTEPGEAEGESDRYAHLDCEGFEALDAEEVVPDVLSLFGKKHTLAIMYEFAFSERALRFKDLESRLGISSTTLSNRLAELTEEGYVERHSYDEIPPRVEYEATEKTHALTPIFEDLYEWAATYETDAEFSEKADPQSSEHRRT